MAERRQPKRILITSSTFPASTTDPVPGFVKDEAIWLKKTYPHLTIDVLAPHNAYSHTKSLVRRPLYDEHRFHYFWPFGLEKLAGRGIQPALKNNKLLYIELPFLFFAEFWATWRLVRRLKPDLIYAHWFTPQAITGAMVSKLTGVPLVFDSQASDVIVLKKLPLARHMVAAVCRRARAYTVPSQQTADKLLYFATARNKVSMTKKLHMIPMGTAYQPPQAGSRQALRQQYKLAGKKTILFIGRLVDRKGIDILIQAFAKLAKQDAALRLVIAGDGQAKADLQALVSKLGLSKSVVFTGFMSGQRKYALLSLVDIVALPSINIGDYAEGLPIVFMEALSHGKVTVISDATGAHEVVQPGHNAFVARAGSVADLSAKLRLALQVIEMQDKKFLAAVKVLARTFAWPNIIRQRYDALIDRFL